MISNRLYGDEMLPHPIILLVTSFAKQGICDKILGLPIPALIEPIIYKTSKQTNTTKDMATLTRWFCFRETLGYEGRNVVHEAAFLGEDVGAVQELVFPGQARTQPLGHVVAQDLQVSSTCMG